MSLDFLAPGTDRIDDEYLRRHAAWLPGMRSMILRGKGITDRGVALLADCQELKELHLIETAITDRALQDIGRLRSLDWLVIDGAQITGQGLRNLGSLDRLQGFHLLSTKIEDDELSVLFHFPSLHYLEVVQPSLGSTGLSCIAQVPTLDILRVGSHSATDRDFINLAFGQSLKSVAFDMPLVTDNAIREVSDRLGRCLVYRYANYRTDERLVFLARHCITVASHSEYFDALATTDEILKQAPFDPSLHGVRAFLNLRLGDYESFRSDLANTRDNASIYGEEDLLELSRSILAINDPITLRRVVEDSRPEIMVANKLLTKGGRYVRKHVPIATLVKRACQRDLDMGLGLPVMPEGLRPEVILLGKLKKGLPQDQRELQEQQQGQQQDYHAIDVPWYW